MSTYLDAKKYNYLSYPMGGRACKTSVILMVHCKLKRKLGKINDLSLFPFHLTPSMKLMIIEKARSYVSM